MLTNISSNVLDAPEVKLLGIPEGDLEENKNSVTLRCLADSNPPSQIVWKKSGGSQVYGYEVSVLVGRVKVCGD